MTWSDLLTVTIGIVIGILGYIIFQTLFIGTPVTTQEDENVASNEDEAKFIANVRQTFANNIIEAFLEVMDLEFEDINKRVDILGYYGAVIHLTYRNSLYRFYIDWKKGKLTVVASFKWSKGLITNKRTFHFKSLQSFFIEDLVDCLYDFRRIYLKCLTREIKELGITAKDLEEIFNKESNNDDDSSEEEAE